MTIGKTLGSYRLVEPLGSGAMGEVYKAVDGRMFDRTVAVKLLPERFATDHQALERFRREIQLAANLHHPGVVTIHDHGEQDGRLFYVMEFIDGVKLSRVIHDESDFPPGRRLDLGAQICAGLQHIHLAGIVHRDLKPGNVMVSHHGSRDVVKLLDFGIAQVAESDLTRPAAQPGTASYMSPEQARGEPLDLRSDLFSLGIVLYELLSGVHPFAADTETLVTVSILQEDPLPLREIRPDLPEGVSAIVARALSKNPDGRPGSAAEIEAVLLAARDRMSSRPGPHPSATPASDRRQVDRRGDLLDSAPTTMPELDEARTRPANAGGDTAPLGPEAPSTDPRSDSASPGTASPPTAPSAFADTQSEPPRRPVRTRSSVSLVAWILVVAVGVAAAALYVGWQMLAPRLSPNVGPAANSEPRPETPAPVPDEVAIRDVLDRWRRAYEARDVDAILEVYPGLEDSGGMRLYFSRMQWLRVTIEQVRVDAPSGGDLASAECRVGLTFLNVGAAQPSEASLISRFRLMRSDTGEWRIARQEFVE